MKWLQGNPIGIALAGFSGFLLFVALIIAVVASLPVSVEVDENAIANQPGSERVVMADRLEPLEEYDVINQKPVFNESRQPVLEVEGPGDEEEELVNPEIAVTAAPDVKLTGIIIAPGMKLASMTPNDASIETVMAYEGDALTGEFLGWHVSQVDARKVTLKSLDNQTMVLELEVHDSQIQAPIKPAAPPPQVAAAMATDPNAEAVQQSPQAAVASDDTDEAPSRAEQIRQRIAERREELRREQEARQKQQGQPSAATSQRASRASRSSNNSAYQNAIRARINNASRNESSDDNKDG